MNRKNRYFQIARTLTFIFCGLGMFSSAWADTTKKFDYAFNSVIPGYQIAAYGAPARVSGVLTFDSAGALASVSDITISTLPGNYIVTSVTGNLKNYSFAFKIELPAYSVTVYYDFYFNFTAPYMYSYHHPENSPEYFGGSYLVSPAVPVR